MDEARLLTEFGSLTPDQAAALDAAALASGVDILQLMEVAGLQVARCAWRLLGEAPGDVLVVAGRGNNGGDGLVAARLLEAWGCRVRSLVVAAAEELRGALAHQLGALRGGGCEVAVGAEAGMVQRHAAAAALTVDALLGTGLREAPRSRDAAVIEALGGTRVLAVDVPSGLDAGSGETPGAALAATATCTLTAVKRGLWTSRGRAHAGDLWAADIGMPAAAWRAAGLRPPRALRAAALLPVPAATPRAAGHPH